VIVGEGVNVAVEVTVGELVGVGVNVGEGVDDGVSVGEAVNVTEGVNVSGLGEGIMTVPVMMIGVRLIVDPATCWWVIDG
jgi:hypothetical protein